MATLFYFPSRTDDIVFARRNKKYGAYILRSEYALNLAKSLLFPLVVMCLCCLCYYFTRNASEIAEYIPKIISEQSRVTVVEVDLNKKNEEAQKSLPKKEPANGKTIANALIVKDQTEIKKDSLSSTLNLSQDSAAHLENIKTGNNNKDSGGADSKGSASVSTTAAVLVPDEMPEFEGGLSALYAFISRHIHYPHEAREAMKQAKVSVRFIVDENGRVILPIAMNRPGFGLDVEAERVVAELPPFKSPAKIGGKAVKCYYVLPINFRLN